MAAPRGRSTGSLGNMLSVWYLAFGTAIFISVYLGLFGLMALLNQIHIAFDPTLANAQHVLLAILYAGYSAGLAAAAVVAWRIRPSASATKQPLLWRTLVTLGALASVALESEFWNQTDSFPAVYFPVPYGAWLVIIFVIPMLPNYRLERP